MIIYPVLPLCAEDISTSTTVGQENPKTSQKRQDKQLHGHWAQDDIERRKAMSWVLRDPVQSSIDLCVVKHFVIEVPFCFPLIFTA